jgi:hypothetical protein
MTNKQKDVNDNLESEDETPESREVDKLMAMPPIFAKRQLSREEMVGRNLMSAAFGVAARSAFGRNAGNKSAVVESRSEMFVRIGEAREKKRKRETKREIKRLKKEGKLTALSPFLIITEPRTVRKNGTRL